MNFEYDETEQMLADSVHRFMDDTAGMEKARVDVALDKGYSAESWNTCAEMGWLAAPFAEENGGFGLGAVGSMIVEEALGKGLSPLPYLTSVVFSGKILEQLGEAVEDLLEGVISGEKVLSIALHETGKGYAYETPSTTATLQNGEWVLNGAKSNIVSAGAADGFIVSATVEGDGFGLFYVEAGEVASNLREINLVDNRRAGHISFEAAKAARLDEGNGLEIFDNALDEVLIAAAAENLGAMQAAFDQTLEYAKIRKQFGKELGKFQVLQHRLVDMSIKVEEARSIIMAAAMALKEGHEDAKSLSRAAWVQSLWSGRHVGEEAIQIHGGIGMTDELEIGDFVKRINANELLFGIPMHHIERYNTLMA